MVKSLLQCPSATGWWSRDQNIKISLMDLNLMLTWRKVEEHRRKRIENNEEGKETIKKLLQKHRWQMKEIVMYPLSSPMNYCVKPSLKP